MSAQAENQKDQEKKGGAAPWMSAPANIGAGASSAAGASAGKSPLLLKLAALMGSKWVPLATIAAGFGVGVHGTMDMNARGGFGVEPVQQKLEFDRKHVNYSPQDASGLPGISAGAKSALELAYDANAGRVGEAAKAGPEAAGEVQVDEAAASADAVGQTQAEGAANGNDPNALMANLMGEEKSKAKSGLANKFGQMSAGLGGGRSQLSGGAGMAGGIGGQFSQPQLSNRTLAKLSTMSQGQKAGIGRAKSAARGAGGGRINTGANGARLDRMQRAMGASKAEGGETQAGVHTRQWDSASVEGGGGSGSGAGTVGGDFSESEGDGLGASLNDQRPSANPEPASVPRVGKSKNITPWQQMTDMGTLLMYVASGLLLLATVLGLIAKGGSVAPPVAAALYAAAKYIAFAAMAVAAIVTLMGVLVMAQGQMTQGALFTGIGGLMTALSYVAAEGFGEAATAQASANAAAQTTAQSVSASLTPVMGGAGANAVGAAAGAGVQAAGSAAAASSVTGGVTAAGLGGSAAGIGGATGAEAAGD